MTKKQKKAVVLTAVLSLCLGIVPSVSAMHIMEGYLPVEFLCYLGSYLCPVFIGGIF